MDVSAWQAPGQIRAPEKRGALAAYVECGNVTQAMQAVGMHRNTWYDWRQNDPDFDGAAAMAEEAAADLLEAVARKRAMDATQPSDTLLIFLLKGSRPAKYRERYSLEHTGPNGGPIQTEDVTVVRERVRNRLAAFMGTGQG